MDASEKRKKIESLASEVSDIHPYLEELLKQLPGIKNVRYTHGSQEEKGADFVLTKPSELMGEPRYIGVIVKKGKIHMDFSDVERQIDECSLGRYSPSIKTEIFLTEVWVIATGNITAHAKEKIHHKFNTRAIEFIDSQYLSEWTDKYLPNWWYDFSTKTGEYLNDLWIKNDENDKRLNLIRSCNKKIYIEHDVFQEVPEYTQGRKVKHTKVNIFDEIKSKDVLLIQGNMGAGKSKLIRCIIDHYASGSVYAVDKLLPVYISFSELVDNFSGDISLLVKSKVGEETIKGLDKENRFLILVDGVDEKNLEAEEKLKTINSIVSETLKNNHKVILTTRFFRNIEINHGISINASKYELKPLSTEKILEFLKVFCNQMNLSKRIIEDVKRSGLLNDLPRSPIAAILLADLLDMNSKDLPSNITELYSKYLELSLGRWDIEKGLQSQKEYEVTESVMMLLAVYLIENNLPCISVDEAASFFEKYILDRNIGLDSKVLFKKVLDRTGILIKDPFKEVVCFKHKSFVEYFYAKSKLADKSLVIDEIAFDVYWDSIYFFYFGLLKECGPELKKLIELQPKKEFYRWNKMINMSNFYLAAYKTPYKYVQENFHKIMLEGALLFQQIVNKEIKSPFGNFPEVHILWFFQEILRDSYGYEYFKKAIDDVQLRIDDENVTDSTKMYALFFTAVTSFDLGIKNPFGYLMSKYGKQLPVQLRIATLHETENHKLQNDVLKKQAKKLKQSIKLDPEVRRFVKSLYETPIKDKKTSNEKLKLEKKEK
jgi:DNA-binding NarL/FixJ family response regulator